MAWKAVHPDLTEEVTPIEGGPSFTVGFWPPREAERLNVLLSDLKQPGEISPHDDYDAYIKSIGLTLEAVWDMAKYGVRGWSGFGDFAPAFEEIESGRFKHKALADASVRLLYVNKLLIAVATKCWLFNSLTEEQRGKSDWRSGSSTTSPSTNAAGAAPATHPKTEESPSD